MKHIVPVFIVLLWGCRDSTAREGNTQPIEIVGRYEMTSLNGSALPVNLPLDQSPRMQLLADTVWFSADSTFRQIRVQQVIGPANQVVFSGTYTVRSDTVVELRYENLAGVSVGVARAGELELPGGSRGPAIYRRSCIGVTC